MKNLEIHHVLNGKVVVTTLIDVSDGDAHGAITSLSRLRAKDGCLVGDNFAIPARSIELIKVMEGR